MSISALSSTLYSPSNTVVSAESREIFTDPSGQQVPSTTAQTDSATTDFTRQNVPPKMNDETSAALLALQETGTTAAEADGAKSSVTTVLFQGRETTMKVYSNLKATRFVDLPDDQFNTVIADMQRSLEADYMKLDNMTQPDPSYLANHPAMKPYATVAVDGKVVATLDNQGLMQTSDEQLYQRLAAIIPNAVNGTNGPDLAQARAQQIAAALDGKVVRSTSAMTQAAFYANPIDQDRLRPQVNRDAMMRDPMYQQIEDLKAQRAAMARG